LLRRLHRRQQAVYDVQEPARRHVHQGPAAQPLHAHASLPRVSATPAHPHQRTPVFSSCCIAGAAAAAAAAAAACACARCRPALPGLLAASTER
jgi:hypothetical protein